MSLRLYTFASCLAAAAMLLTTACEDTAGKEENASVVNVEKDVAPEMATPEAAGILHVDQNQPVGIIDAKEAAATYYDIVTEGRTEGQPMAPQPETQEPPE